MASDDTTSNQPLVDSDRQRRDAAAVTTNPRPRDDVAFEDVTDSNFVYEFGGPIGAASMIVG
ncbi:hypothetical protein IW150_007256, partial [Coemansia sp. RSA 2607]